MNDIVFEKTSGNIVFEHVSPNITFTVGYGTTGGATHFTDLNDTPDNYAGHSGKAALVNQAEDGLEFGEVSVSSTFLELTDTPPTYVGQAGNLVKVNNTEDGLTYGGASGVQVAWGDITGTLSNQTDLQSELDAKEDAFAKNTAFNKNFGSAIDTVTQGNDPRLSDNRDPNPHTHTETDVTDLDKYTQAEVDAALALKEDAFSKNTGFNKNFGALADTVTEGNDSRLSDARTPTAHAASHADGGSDEISHTTLADIGTLTHTQIETSLNNKIEAVFDDPTPKLGGDLDTLGQAILFGDGAGGFEGIIANLATGNGSGFGYSSDGTYDPADGSVIVEPGEVTLSGTVAKILGLSGTDNRDVQVAPDGTLYAAALPDPGWSHSDTDAGSYALTTLGAWVELTGLDGVVQADVSAGDRLDITANIYVNNTSATRGGTIDIGFNVGEGVAPTSGVNFGIPGGFSGYVPVNFSTTTHGGLVTNDIISIWARRATEEQAQFAPVLDGTIQVHELIISVPGAGGGGGGDATNLGNIPGPSSVTITSSTGSNTVVVGAVSGTAGMMTGAQVDTLNAALQDITGESIKDLSDVNSGMTPIDGQALVYDTGNGWQAENLPATGATQLSELSDVTSAVQTNGFVLASSGGNYAGRALVVGDIPDLSSVYEPAFSKNTGFNKNFGSLADTVVEGNDSRLSDARTPLSHAASHADGGSDELDVSDLASGSATLDQVPLADGAGGVTWGNQSGGGASTFTDLTDTPGAYLGQAGNIVVVNGTEDGLTFDPPSGGGAAAISEHYFLGTGTGTYNLSFDAGTIQVWHNGQLLQKGVDWLEGTNQFTLQYTEEVGDDILVTRYGNAISGWPEVLPQKMLDAYLERQNVQNSVTNVTIDIADGTVQYVSMTGAGTVTLADTLTPTMVDQDGTASMTVFLQSSGNAVTWDPNINWIGGSEPTRDPTGHDMFSFHKQAGSTKWVGLHAGAVASLT